MTGGPLGVAQPGVAGKVVFTSAAKSKTVDAKPDGSFTASLSAGTYIVTGSSRLFEDGRGVCRADKPVTVASQAVFGVVVACSRR